MGDEWYSTFDSVFWVTIGTMTFAFLGLVIKTALASKCDNLDLCYGCVKIHRAVELEIPSYTQPTTQEEERKTTLEEFPNPPSPPSIKH